MLCLREMPAVGAMAVAEAAAAAAANIFSLFARTLYLFSRTVRLVFFRKAFCEGRRKRRACACRGLRGLCGPPIALETCVREAG
mmetsp:Transcript_25766/g.41233  ORF Transcript_25766/g.41233 Transcript_25766/m.41233 type:complete len:84 (+) Transcript_25766:1254-1505(+)